MAGPMHKVYLSFALLFMAATSPGTRGAGPTVSLQSLLTEMVNRDAAARFPVPAYTCRQASSYDRASVSPEQRDTWMANNDRSFFIRREMNEGREEWVMLDADGPGCIVRFWATSGNAAGNIRVYLDDASDPVINEPAKGLVGGDALVGPPLSKVRARGMNLYLPIPYAQKCKITYDRPNFHETKDESDLLYYQINYRTYEPGTEVESFSRQAFEDAQDQIAELQRTLLAPQDVVPNEITWRELSEVPLRPNSAVATGFGAKTAGKHPGAIRQLMVRVDAKNLQAATRSTVLTLKFDERETAVCPVGDFFGSGVGVNPYTGWWRAVDESGWMTCYWVMPYRESCVVELSNRGSEDVRVQVKVATGPWDWDERSMHFHTNWHHEYPIDTSAKSDWNYVQLCGEGVYMGDTLCVTNPVRAWWGEGDEKIYVDGETFPSHFGTGTEDYYGYAWCTPQFFESPFHSQPLAEGPGNFGQVTNTRVRLLDGIPFRKSLRFDMEVWHWRPVNIAYAATTYWYGLPGAKGNHVPEPDMLRVIHVERPQPRKVKGAVEGEGLTIREKTGGVAEIQDADQFKWSDNKQIWWRDGKPGDKLVLDLPVETSGRYQLKANLTMAVDYGIVRLSLDGQPLGEPIDLFHRGVTNKDYDLGVHPLNAGNHELAAEVAGANPNAVKRHMFGIDYVMLVPVR